jgi:thiamine biosynthesis protein ThiS
MLLVLNGKEQEINGVATIHDLIHKLGLADHPVAVELNCRVVPKARFAETRLKEGDKVEIVHFVGGG